MADTHLSLRSGLEDEVADTVEVEEQVDAVGTFQTSSDPQSVDKRQADGIKEHRVRCWCGGGCAERGYSGV